MRLLTLVIVFTRRLLDSAGLSKVVRIGDFLDIMCPHTGLTGTVKANATSMFNIYRVYDSDSFDSCRVTSEFTVAAVILT